ncbi:MAG: methyltransferase domain-containing protein [Candidatus Hydrogenedentes bacterium]|nr:methyltransferase domain-containing protein [Candidatus Hydrogenedentota bacterium]
MTIAKQAYEHYEAAGKETGVFPLVENMRVLEIGFGAGALLEALQARGNDTYGLDVGKDIVDKAVERGLKNVFLLDVSEEALPFEDDFFDAIYCYEVIEHLTNPHRLFSEIRRVLKRDHPLFFSAPAQEIDMGYGMGRHPFVYPGLLEKPNLERFFMQMYFRIEEAVESGRLLEGRSYVLRNGKGPGKPDIVEVVTGPHNLIELYGDVLGEERLQAELARETAPYLSLIAMQGQSGAWDQVLGLTRYLLTQFPDYLPVYLQLAELFFSLNRTEEGKRLLHALLDRPNLPMPVARRAQDLLAARQEPDAGE